MMSDIEKQEIEVKDALNRELFKVNLSPNFNNVDDKLLNLYFYYVVKAENANVRESNAVTKTRGEVRGGGRKIRPQKGTGFARQSSIRAPHWKGGGVVFGPNQNRNYTQKVNRKLRLKLLGLLLMKNVNNFYIIKDDLNNYKTKDIKNTFLNSGFFIHSVFESNLAIRNLPHIKLVHCENLPCKLFGYDKHKTLYITFSALEYLCAKTFIELKQIEK